nr:MAG TPA: hypothetical protein [Caudoviricetes sp.]
MPSCQGKLSFSYSFAKFFWLRRGEKETAPMR